MKPRARDRERAVEERLVLLQWVLERREEIL